MGRSKPKSFLSRYALDQYVKWGRRHFPMPRAEKLEGIFFLYSQPGATLDSVGARLGLSREMVRKHLMDREYALRCECERLRGLDLSNLVRPKDVS